MRYSEWRDPATGEYILEVRFTQLDLARVNLSSLERAALNTPREFAVADRLMDAQMIAHALEQKEARTDAPSVQAPTP